MHPTQNPAPVADQPTYPACPDEISAVVAVVATAGATLRSAARYLLEHGWHQGDLFADLVASYLSTDATVAAIPGGVA